MLLSAGVWALIWSIGRSIFIQTFGLRYTSPAMVEGSSIPLGRSRFFPNPPIDSAFSTAKWRGLIGESFYPIFYKSRRKTLQFCVLTNLRPVFLVADVHWVMNPVMYFLFPGLKRLLVYPLIIRDSIRVFAHTTLCHSRTHTLFECLLLAIFFPD